MNEELKGYVIVETQTADDGSISVLHFTESGRNNALSVFYQKCSYAAISAARVHTVCIFDIYGNKADDPVTFTHEGGAA